MMLAQLEERAGNGPAARRVLQTALKHSQRCVPLWLLLARLEEAEGLHWAIDCFRDCLAFDELLSLSGLGIHSRYISLVQISH
jgi:hypothetical protein